MFLNFRNKYWNNKCEHKYKEIHVHIGSCPRFAMCAQCAPIRLRGRHNARVLMRQSADRWFCPYARARPSSHPLPYMCVCTYPLSKQMHANYIFDPQPVPATRTCARKFGSSVVFSRWRLKRRKQIESVGIFRVCSTLANFESVDRVCSVSVNWELIIRVCSMETNWELIIRFCSV